MSYLALIITVPLVSIDTGQTITLRKAGIGVLVPNKRDYWKRDLLCLMNALQNLAVGSSWKIRLSHVIFFYCKLFAVRFSSFGHTHKPCQHSLMWSALLISVGQLLVLEDEGSFVESKQEWGERWHTFVCVCVCEDCVFLPARGIWVVDLPISCCIKG